MPTEILMPALSPTMTEGKLAKWLKQEGDSVSAGEVIAEIETDKATMEVEAVDEGTLGKILVPEGTASVAVNTPIAVLLEDGEDMGAYDPQTPATQKDPAGSADAKTQDAPAPRKDLPSPSSAPALPSTGHNTKTGRIFATPLARRLAKDSGIDLSHVQGSGPNGRIVKADIEAAQRNGNGAPAAPSSPSSVRAQTLTPSVNAKTIAQSYDMAYTEIPHSTIRKTIARRLLESKQTVPHFYLTIDCRIDSLLAARQDINAQADGAFKLSVNDFVIKACAHALKAVPQANVAWTEDSLLQFDHADISVAVATPQGLITPIVKSAQTKGLRQIANEVKDLAARARSGALKPAEYEGGTFTISNLGMYGIRDFAAIINPPQACILAVGAGEQRPFVEGGEIRIGTFMTCTLSADHRAVDGAVGAQWLDIFKKCIENPVTMLV